MPELLERPRLEQLVLRGDIIPDTAGVNAAERSKTMRLGTSVQYVQHRTFSGYGGVRNQQAVAPPRNRFGAHDHRWLQSRQLEEIFERLFELARFHVIRVGAKARVSPQRVVRVASPASPTTKRWQVRVPQAGIDQRPLESRSGKMRVSRRCGKGANIDEMCHAFSCQQPEELLERSGGMPDRKKSSGAHAP